MTTSNVNSPGPRILIVDDEPDNRVLFRIMLESGGFVIQTASDGEEALLSVVTDPPDAILVDLMMPGMDGCQLTARLKQCSESEGIPVIMLSAMNDSVVRKRALGSGAVAYVTKPIHRSELCEQVRNVLRLKERDA